LPLKTIQYTAVGNVYAQYIYQDEENLVKVTKLKMRQLLQFADK